MFYREDGFSITGAPCRCWRTSSCGLQFLQSMGNLK